MFPGMTPLLAAAVTGHIHIVEYLIANADLVSRQERIDALELLGATFVDKKRDMLGSFKLWKRAMEDRYSTPTQFSIFDYDYCCRFFDIFCWWRNPKRNIFNWIYEKLLRFKKNLLTTS